MTSMQVFQFAVTSFGFVSWIVGCRLIYSAIKKFRYRQLNDEVHPILPFFRNSTLITMFSFVLSSFIMLLMSIVYISDRIFYFHSPFFAIMAVSSVVVFAIAKISLYVLFIGRLYYSFRDSVYALHYRSLFIIAFMFAGSIIGAFFILYHKLIGLIIFVCFEILLCSIILKYFVSRLLKLTARYKMSALDEHRKKKSKFNTHHSSNHDTTAITLRSTDGMSITDEDEDEGDNDNENNNPTKTTATATANANPNPNPNPNPNASANPTQNANGDAAALAAVDGDQQNAHPNHTAVVAEAEAEAAVDLHKLAKIDSSSSNALRCLNHTDMRFEAFGAIQETPENSVDESSVMTDVSDLSADEDEGPQQQPPPPPSHKNANTDMNINHTHTHNHSHNQRKHGIIQPRSGLKFRASVCRTITGNHLTIPTKAKDTAKDATAKITKISITKPALNDKDSNSMSISVSGSVSASASASVSISNSLSQSDDDDDDAGPHPQQEQKALSPQRKGSKDTVSHHIPLDVSPDFQRQRSYSHDDGSRMLFASSKASKVAKEARDAIGFKPMNRKTEHNHNNVGNNTLELQRKKMQMQMKYGRMSVNSTTATNNETGPHIPQLAGAGMHSYSYQTDDVSREGSSTGIMAVERQTTYSTSMYDGDADYGYGGGSSGENMAHNDNGIAAHAHMGTINENHSSYTKSGDTQAENITERSDKHEYSSSMIVTNVSNHGGSDTHTFTPAIHWPSDIGHSNSETADETTNAMQQIRIELREIRGAPNTNANNNNTNNHNRHMQGNAMLHKKPTMSSMSVPYSIPESATVTPTPTATATPAAPPPLEIDIPDADAIQFAESMPPMSANSKAKDARIIKKNKAYRQRMHHQRHHSFTIVVSEKNQHQNTTQKNRKTKMMSKYRRHVQNIDTTPPTMAANMSDPPKDHQNKDTGHRPSKGHTKGSKSLSEQNAHKRKDSLKVMDIYSTDRYQRNNKRRNKHRHGKHGKHSHHTKHADNHRYHRRSVSFDPQKRKYRTARNYGRNSVCISPIPPSMKHKTGHKSASFEDWQEIQKSQTRQRSNSCRSTDTWLTQSQIELVQTMTRSTLLGFICMFATMTFTIFAVIRFQVHSGSSRREEQASLESWLQTLFLFTHDILNCLCVYFNLEFSKQIYLRVCNGCDYVCEWIGIRYAEHHIEQLRKQRKQRQMPRIEE